MDNLSAYEGGRVRKVIEARDCDLRYLPSCSLDLNPIEGTFSKLKGLVREAEARFHGALIEAMDRPPGTMRVMDARDFFPHCGY